MMCIVLFLLVLLACIECQHTGDEELLGGIGEQSWKALIPNTAEYPVIMWAAMCTVHMDTQLILLGESSPKESFY